MKYSKSELENMCTCEDQTCLACLELSQRSEPKEAAIKCHATSKTCYSYMAGNGVDFAYEEMMRKVNGK